ncbi:hypothetical protein C8Q76DRAFT_219342 [Earliella scabrosa]|nr:hypothetical protein C8Q76DRAFT_219342 [Earliella scabrosa]
MLAVERALHCRDIVLEIIDYFAPNQANRDSKDAYTQWLSQRSSLAYLARTCRAFYDPALDMLWHAIDDLDVLFKVLPSFREYACGRTVLSYYNTITEAEWSRFEDYAGRVCDIKRGNLLHHVTPSVWPVLARRLGGVSLLPYLRKLVLDISVYEPACGIILLSPSVRDLTVSFSFGYPFEGSGVAAPHLLGCLLHLITQKIPDLEHLTVPYGLRELTPAYTHVLANFHALRILNMVGSGAVFGYHDLQVLSRMPTLRELGLQVDLRAVDSCASLGFDGGLSTLKKLDLVGCWGDLSKVVCGFQCQVLEELTLRGNTIVYPVEFQHALTSIIDCVGDSVTSLCLAAYISSRRPVLSISELVKPAMPVRTLTSFRLIVCEHALPVSDADLQTLADAWPHLSSLRLSELFPLHSTNTVGPTVHALSELVRRCPGLTTLELPAMNVSRLQRSRPAIMPSHPSLRELKLQQLVGAEYADLLDVAVVLDMLFPNMETLRHLPGYPYCAGVGPSSPPDSDPWRVTLMLLAGIRARRSAVGLLAGARCENEILKR